MTSCTGKALVQSTVLTVLAILFTLGMAEIGLRLFYPKYEFAAEAQFKPDSLRITTRPPNSRRTMRHPDNGKTHLVIYNNYGMRQHRDFQDSDLEGATNVGMFGDSYLENGALPGPYSFTEPYELFSKQIPDYDYRDWAFKNDGHWAEAANSLAATFFYRDIAQADRAGHASGTRDKPGTLHLLLGI